MSNSPSNQVPAWFHNAVVDGLQRLHTLCLPNSPSAETIQLTANVWIDTLWDVGGWHDATDARRLARAFNAIAAKAERWPAPRHVREELPQRPDLPALPPPGELVERRQANVERLRQLKLKLHADLVIKPLAHPASAAVIAERMRAEQAATATSSSAQETRP